MLTPSPGKSKKPGVLIKPSEEEKAEEYIKLKDLFLNRI
jgi:hypothetical protein